MSGHCAMRGSCGSTSEHGPQLPCAYSGLAIEPDTATFRTKLISVCGPDFTKGPVCCTVDQVATLQTKLQEADALIRSCPACRNNFRDLFCSFTCSPQQGAFLNVSSTQKTSSSQTAVKTVEFHVGSRFGQGFFASCQDIKLGATNDYAMDFLGGGATTYPQFLKYLGDARPQLGSPFQINFPNVTTSPDLTPFNPFPRSCADTELSSRCACTDCPSVCPILPEIPPPNTSACHIGLLSCLSFTLIIVYAFAVTGFAGGYGIVLNMKKRRNQLGRIALSNGNDTPSSGLVGATSLATYYDDSASDTRQSLGRGVSLLDHEGFHPRQNRLSNLLRRFFYRVGYASATSPFVTFFVAFTFIAISNGGWKFFDIEKDPVRLWASPSSESRVQKEFFDQHFGPAYRFEQIFVTPSVSIPHAPGMRSTANPGHQWLDRPVLSYDLLRWWLQVESNIRSLRSREHGYGLEDVCLKPSGPDGSCVVQSIAAWLGNDLEKYNADTWSSRIVQCANTPAECLADFGQPIRPEYVLGGIPNSSAPSRWLDARSLVITYVVSDSAHSSERSKVEEWEVELRRYLESLSNQAPAEAGVQVLFTTGVSLEEELNKSSNTDVKTVVLSYLFMFLYVSLTLGRGDGEERPGYIAVIRSWFTRSRSGPMSSASSGTSYRGGQGLLRRVFVGSKVVLGSVGLLLVMISVTSSVGIFSYLGVKVTLVIAEAIPFLVLAVGVDNLFLLLGELDRQNSFHGPNASAVPPSTSMATPMSPSQRRSPFGSNMDSAEADSGPAYLSPEERVARATAKIGPSILMSTGTQAFAFGLGALVPMPAVRNFALYAALSVLVNALLQTTVFVSAMTLDLRRTESNRVDCFPCIKIPSRIGLPDNASQSPGGVLTRFFRRAYAPLLLQSTVKGIVLALFGAIMVLSIISVQHIELGLDQRLAVPFDSYLIQYFDAVEMFLDVGPPVYFVVSDIDPSERSNQRSLCSRFTTCEEFSIGNVLEAERKRPESSFITQPPAVWIDDFLYWLNPDLGTCCRVRKDDPASFCQPGDPERLCRPCLAGRVPPWSITMDGLPQGDEFNRFLSQWLLSDAHDECPLGGRQAYSTALSSDQNNTVIASHFRTYHSPLRNQADYINAYEAAHRIADDLSQRTGAKVFPYSVFHVFFEQYSYIVGMTQEILGLGLAAVLLVTSVMLGSWRTGMIVTGVVGLTVLSVMGVMGAWSISLNAISLVNLVISLGIAVEFCSHIARGYVSAGGSAGLIVDGDGPGGQKDRDERVFSVLVDVGPSVLLGITFTKLIGIAVLACAQSRLLEIYFFRMWLSLIVLGALHGLVLLPVLLSFAGGPGYALEDADEEWMSSAVRRHDYEYTPFLADNDSILSY